MTHELRPTPFALSARLLTCTALACSALAMAAWNAPGHRVITQRAVQSLPPEAPAWLTTPDMIAQIAFQANEPDRWRGVRVDALSHENNPDHFLDIELLYPRGMKVETLPRLRYEFVEAWAKAEPPAPTPPPTENGKPARRGVVPTKDDVGYLPWAIAEHHAKLLATFNTLRILEELNDPARGPQLAATKANVIHEMGQLSHFVGDSAQPLHTTIHHHGWVGDNPDGFTSERSFHSYIDGDIVALHGIGLAALTARAQTMRPIGADSVWDETIAVIQRSHAQMRPLYELQKSGQLQRDEGRVFITDRMADAASVLAGLYWHAWQNSVPTAQQKKDFVRYDAAGAELMPPHKAAPAQTAPAQPAPTESAPATSADLRPQLEALGFTPRPQGPRGTCSIFTTCSAIEFALAKRSGKAVRMSPEYLNWAGATATNRPSDGNFFHNALAGWEAHGLCSEEAMPYEAAYDAARKPSPRAAEEASKIKADSKGTIAVRWIVPWTPDHFGVNDAQFKEIKRVLASGYPVAAGSGHSRLLVGFKDDPQQPGGGTFITLDSGSNRFDSVTYEFVQKQVADVFWVEAMGQAP